MGKTCEGLCVEGNVLILTKKVTISVKGIF